MPKPEQTKLFIAIIFYHEASALPTWWKMRKKLGARLTHSTVSIYS